MKCSTYLIACVMIDKVLFLLLVEVKRKIYVCYMRHCTQTDRRQLCPKRGVTLEEKTRCVVDK